MTIALSANTPRISYTVSQGVTQTSFAVPFVFFTKSTDLNVFVDNTERTFDASTSNTTLYTVSGGDGSTGTVTTSVTGATGGSTVVITRAVPLSRTTDFPSSGAFEISKLNTELDTIVTLIADADDENSRTLRLKESDAAVDLTLPLKADRLGTVLGFNATTGAAEAGPTIANVNSLSAITANINTVAGISANVTTVAGIASNVTTVAGISSNVTSVAGIASNVTTVAGKASLITSDFAADMALIDSTFVSKMNLVTSDFVTDMAAVTSDFIADLNTLATTQIVADLDLLATSDFVSDLNAVEGIKANVTTVAGVASNVTTVAGIASNVTTVAGDASDIGTVASAISNINTVASANSNISTVASANSNISTVAGSISNVNTVASADSNITALNASGVISNIATVAGAVTNVNNVGGSITNVNTVASNLSGVNSFAERYRVASSDPSSNNDEGDLVYNTTDNNLKFFNGSSFVAVGGAISNIVEDTTPQLGGDLDVVTHSIVSTSDRNIAITPNGSGKVVLDGISYPNSDGTNGQVLQTNGSGVLSFGTIDLSSKADVASPTFTGTPAAPTATASTNTTQLATTAFVTTAVANAEPFPSGTSMLFQQTSAPTGWTKQTTHNDKALRIVTGSVGTGGSVAFSTALGSGATVAGGTVSGSPASNLSVSVSGNISNHTLSINQIPSHSHQTKRAETGGNLLYYGNSVGFGGNVVNNNSVVPTANAGGGGSHNHGHNLSGSISGNITAGNLAVGSSTAAINVNYVDFIIANKD